MKNLNAYGVTEMSGKEAAQVDGGIIKLTYNLATKNWDLYILGFQIF